MNTNAHTHTHTHTHTSTHIHRHTNSHMNAHQSKIPQLTACNNKPQNQHHQSKGTTSRRRKTTIDRKRWRKKDTEKGKELKKWTNSEYKCTHAHAHTHTHIHRHTHSHINAHQSRGPQLTYCNHKTPKTALPKGTTARRRQPTIDRNRWRKKETEIGKELKKWTNSEYKCAHAHAHIHAHT